MHRSFPLVRLLSEASTTLLRILPLIVDACGWNVHMRDCIFSAAPPRGEDSPGPTALAAAWHFDQEEEYQGLTANGEMPLVDFKVSYYLSDHTRPGHSCTVLVPGSHRWSPAQRASWQDWLRPEHVVPLRVPIGSVLLWRSSLLHAVSPNLDSSWRFHLYFSCKLDTLSRFVCARVRVP